MRWSFPLLLSAIDPAAEARLTGLDRAVTGGRYLRGSDRTRLVRTTGPGADYPPRVLPVLANAHTSVDEHADVVVRRLSAAAVHRWVRPFGADDFESLASLRFLRRQPPGPVVLRRSVGAGGGLRRAARPARAGNFQDVSAIWRVGPIRYARREGVLHPATRAADSLAWLDNVSGSGRQWAFAPPSVRDTWVRDVRGTRAVVTPATPPARADPFLTAVGRFDVGRLPSARAPGAPALTSLRPPALTGRSAGAVARLGGHSLRANGNLGAYLTQPPALLTTLRAARALDGSLYPGFDARRPISAVRVRVAGVTGPDAVSRERIRQVAQRIATRTGLDVDIVAGASGAPTAVDLPAGRYGRPRLELTAPWIRKGVATRVLRAVDRKSVVLFTLILVVCGLFVANATSAAVRARRTELGILAALGWTTGRLFAVVLAEVAVLGLAAGVLGGLLALPLAARAADRRRPPRRAPGAAGLAARIAAGARGRQRAAHARPDGARGAQPRALLGRAVAAEVRAGDVVAVGATVALGLAAVVDVLVLNLRERSAELATLAATGWDDRDLGRLLACEGLVVGGLGALAGAVTGLAAAAVFAGALPLSLVATTLAAAGAGVVLTGVASLVPTWWLRRVPLAAALAGE